MSSHPQAEISRRSSIVVSPGSAALLTFGPYDDYPACSIFAIHELGRNAGVRRVELHACNVRRSCDFVELCAWNALAVHPEQRHAAAASHGVATASQGPHLNTRNAAEQLARVCRIPFSDFTAVEVI